MTRELAVIVYKMILVPSKSCQYQNTIASIFVVSLVHLVTTLLWVYTAYYDFFFLLNSWFNLIIDLFYEDCIQPEASSSSPQLFSN